MQWHNKETFEILNQYGVSKEKGLSNNEAKKRLEKYGFNKLETKKQKSIWKKLIEQLSDFMVIILLLAAVVSYITSYLQGEADIVEPLIILLIVIINAIIGIFQDYKAEKAIEALKKLSSPTVKVMREGLVLNVNSELIVPGDIIFLESGDFVSADARLIETVNLKIEETSLTGESLPIEKDENITFEENIALGDRKNMAYCSGVVVAGRAKAVVVDIGMNTQVGQIANMLNQNQTPQTPLQKRLEHTGKILGICALVICLFIFIMGIFQNINPIEMFMISVSLAVAAIPEGLPAVVTIVLALGVQRMVKKNAIIRKLPAVETLGSATIICSDKTGTLTQNKMTVTKVATFDEIIDPLNDLSKKIVLYSALCNNSTTKQIKGQYIVSGDPTETALIFAANNLGCSKTAIDNNNPRTGEIPFDSKRKLMTTIHQLDNSKYIVITKGAPEILLKCCKQYDNNEKSELLTPNIKNSIEANNEKMTTEALRVLAIGYKYIEKLPQKINSKTIETDLIFCGLIGMLDPPRPEVKSAVRLCKRAGIKPVMITGDHILTAKAIASEIGIMNFNDKVITGEELNKFSQSQLDKEIEKYSVFARVTPEHKAKIVKAFQSNGHIVAMTGDGVNDAPALKIADIGCAMGITGTDVAKGAADMILTDDNFASIVEAVREGRGIYQNIRKCIHFLLSSNMGEIFIIFLAFCFNLPCPLLPIQLLWINLVTDSLPALALGVDPVDAEVMNNKPINKNKSIFSDGLAFDIILEGIMIGLLALFAFTIGFIFFDKSGEIPLIGRTMAFCVLSLSQLFHAFNTRSKKSLLKIGIFSNKPLILAFIVGAILQLSVVSIPLLSTVFKVVPLTSMQYLIVLLLAIVPIIFVESAKAMSKKS